MRMIGWSPAGFGSLRDLGAVQDEINRLFEGAVSRRWPLGDLGAAFTPAVDIVETAEEFVVKADLPGVAQQDVKVSLMGDTITIRGERRRESMAADVNAHRLERACGAFERTFSLGTAVRTDRVGAQYRDGVLEIHVPKAEEARVREIEVKVG